MQRPSHLRLATGDGEVKERKVYEWFSHVAREASEITGTAWTFGVAVLVVLGWLVSGPLFGFSDTWQLVINTGTTIVTFLMIFLVQHTQNKDTAVIHVKLNELIATQRGASNHLIDLEDMSEADLQRLRIAFQRIADRPDEKRSVGMLSVENEIVVEEEPPPARSRSRQPKNTHGS